MGLYEHLGLRFSLEGEAVVVEMPASEASIGPGGSVHGGLLAMLADLAGAGAVAASEGCLVSTTSLAVTMHSAAKGEVRAVGRASGGGRLVKHATATLTSDGEVVAQGLLTVRVHTSSGINDAAEDLRSSGVSDVDPSDLGQWS